MSVVLEWMGCTTYRLTVDDTVILLDAYIDRVPTAPPVGITVDEIVRADAILVGHSHFDHIGNADALIRQTGADLIGSYETCRVLRDADVDDARLFPAQGGERFKVSESVVVEVLPSLHSCLHAPFSTDKSQVFFGHCGMDEAMKLAAREAGLDESMASMDEDGSVRAHEMSLLGSRHDGGALAFLITTPRGTIFWQDSAGTWTGVVHGLSPDLAILACAGRGNMDGEPFQGSLAQMMLAQVQLMRPRTVLFGHHDNWMPPFTSDAWGDLSHVKDVIGAGAPGVTVLDPGYLEEINLFRN